MQGEGIRNLIHGLQGRMLLLTPAHVIQFRIQLLIGSKDTSGHHRLSHHVRTELVLLLLVLLQVEGLVTEQHSGSLNATTEDAQYIRTGNVTEKTGTQRTLAVNGDRCVGDAFQDFVLSHKIVYGTGSDIIVPYIYFSLRTGKGEKGSAAIIVTSDVGGAAGSKATFACDVKAIGTPDEFTFAEQ